MGSGEMTQEFGEETYREEATWNTSVQMGG